MDEKEASIVIEKAQSVCFRSVRDHTWFLFDSSHEPFNVARAILARLFDITLKERVSPSLLKLMIAKPRRFLDTEAIRKEVNLDVYPECLFPLVPKSEMDMASTAGISDSAVREAFFDRVVAFVTLVAETQHRGMRPIQEAEKKCADDEKLAEVKRNAQADQVLLRTRFHEL
jgi:hypothetical protein